MPDARLLETPTEVEELAETLAGEPLLAFDTEADSFHSYFSKVCLVQVSTRKADFIIDPLATGSLAPLGPVLADPEITCVFHGADYDLRILDRDHGFRVRNLFDTMIAARLLGYTSFGLSSLLERHFGLKLPKTHQRADWSRRPLPPDMLKYAASDTHHLPGLYDILRSELEARGRFEWAKEEFELLEKVRHQPREEDPDAYQRIKGARSLDRRELAVLRELFETRDRMARELDRASFRVLGNATLLALAGAKPKKPRDLAGFPGMPRTSRKPFETELLAAIRRGIEVPEQELPLRKRGSRGVRHEPDPQLAKIRKIRDRVAAELELDPGVVGPNALLEAVARTKPTDRKQLLKIQGMRRWQAGLFGEEVLAVTRQASS